MFIILLLCLLLGNFQSDFASNTSSFKEKIPTTQAYNYEANMIFHMITFPFSKVTDSFTLKIFKYIDQTFGPEGLHLEAKQVDLIKKTYVYLIFTVKLAKVSTDPKYKQYQTYFEKYLGQSNQQMPHIPDEQLLTSPGWNAVQITEEDLLASKVWQYFCKSMVCDTYVYFYTVLNIIHNVETQTFNYIPNIETSFYDKDYTDLRTANEISRIKLILESITKKYFTAQCPDWKNLPNIDPHNDETDKTETLEQAVVQFRQTPFYKKTHNMKELLGVSDTEIISAKHFFAPKQLASPLKEQIWCFFMFKEIMTMMFGLMDKETLEVILTLCSSTPLSPNFFPYTIDDYPYFDELIAVKSKTEGTHTNSTHPSPPTHKYEDTHFVIAYSRHNSQDPTPATKVTKNIVNDSKSRRTEIQTQGLFSWIAHAATHAFHAVKHGVESAAKAVVHSSVTKGILGVGAKILHSAEKIPIVGKDIKTAASIAKKGVTDAEKGVETGFNAAMHTVEGVAQEAAGFAATAGGELFHISGAVTWGQQEEKHALQHLEESKQEFENATTQFTQALEDGIVAPTAYLTGALLSTVFDDQQLGKSITTTLNTVADQVLNVANDITNTLVEGYTDVAIVEMQATATLATIMVSAVAAVYSRGNDLENIKDALMGTLKDTLTSITESMTGLLSASKKVIFGALTALGAIMNAIDTVIVEVSREVTFVLGTVFTLGLDEKNVKEARNNVTNYLNAHRSTIVQAIGVAVSIGVDIATAGAGAEADVAIMAAAEAAAEGGTEAAAKVAAEAGAEAAAKEAAAQAAKEAADQAAEELAVKQALLKTAARKAGQVYVEDQTEIAAKEAAEKAAQAAEKAAEEAAQATAKKEAADQALKDASKEAAQRAAKKEAVKSAEKAVKEADKKVESFGKFTLKKGAKKEAEIAAKSARLTLRRALQREAEAASEDVTKALAQKEAAEVAAKKASEAAAKEGATEAEKQAAKDAEEQLAKASQNLAAKEAEKASTDAAKNAAEKEVLTKSEQKAAEEAEDEAAQQTAKKEAEKSVKDKAKDLIEKSTIGFAKKSVKEGAETALTEAQEEAVRKASEAAEKKIAEEIERKMSRALAEKALKGAGTETEKAAARAAFKKAAEDELEIATKDVAEAQLRKEAAKKTLQEATDEEAEKAAKKELEAASKDLTEKEFEQVAAKKAVSNASKDVAKDIVKKLTEDLAQAKLQKEAAQEAVHKALAREAEILADDTASDEAKQAAKEFVENAQKELDRATKDLIEKEAEKEAAEDASWQATKDALKDNADYYGKAIVRKLAEKAVGILMNSAFGTFSVMAGMNSDAQNAYHEKEQASALRSLWKNLNETKISTAQTQSAYLQEIQEKQKAEIGNRTLALAFYKNIIYQQVESFAEQLSQILTREYIRQLTPDEHDMLPGNIGTLWGLETNYLNLYPSEGFPTVTLGRSDFPFAQEVAQAPLAALPQKEKKSKPTLNKGKEQTKLWFNQKVIALDKIDTSGKVKKADDPLTVGVDIQVLYTLNSGFYTGLYLGGAYNDYTSKEFLNSLQTTHHTDLDTAHLAKMVVLFREKADSPIQLGVYEHEGKGWIFKQDLPSSMQLNKHHTYHLRASLAGSSLQVKLWIDDNKQIILPKITEIEVTPITNQRTYGVIASGIAIQWNQIMPVIFVKDNKSARPPLQQQTELEREKSSKKRIAQLTHPAFGSMKISPISKQSILFGQYMYTTTDTDIKKISPTNSIDYVLFATYENGQTSNIGTAPISINNKTPKPNALVSVITGNVYNESGHSIAHIQNILNSYNKEYGPFDDKIITYIKSIQAIVLKKLAHIKFGSFDLDIIDQEALKKGQFIYECKQTLGIQDAQGNPISDYLITVEFNGNNIGNMIGMPPTSPNATGLVSLVTGNAYAKQTQLTPGKAAPSLENQPELGAYESQFGTIASSSMQKIQASQTAYRSQLTAIATAKKAKKEAVISFSSSDATNNIADHTAPSDGLTFNPGGITLGPPSSGKLSNLQQTAASPVGIQLGSPGGGITLKL